MNSLENDCRYVIRDEVLSHIDTMLYAAVPIALTTNHQNGDVSPAIKLVKRGTDQLLPRAGNIASFLITFESDAVRIEVKRSTSERVVATFDYNDPGLLEKLAQELLVCNIHLSPC